MSQLGDTLSPLHKAVEQQVPFSQLGITSLSLGAAEDKVDAAGPSGHGSHLSQIVRALASQEDLGALGNEVVHGHQDVVQVVNGPVVVGCVQ